MSIDLYIYGFSDYAELCRHYLSMDSNMSFRSFLVDEEYFTGATDHTDTPLSLDDPLTQKRIKNGCLFIAIGYRRMRDRLRCYEKAKSLGSRLTNFVSAAAYIDPSVTMGLNNIVMPGTVIEPNVEIGNNNIFWSNSTICHDTKIGSHNFFGAASVVGGGVTVGNLSFLGFSSIVIQRLTVGNETLLGANSTLMNDSGACGKWLGQPAKLVGNHADEGICINSD